MTEVHRRARLYYNDYGILGAGLLAFSALGSCLLEIHFPGHLAPEAIPDIIAEIWSKLKGSTMLSMDRNSGLGLTTDMYSHLENGRILRWRLLMFQNKWLCSYLPFLARPDVIQLLPGIGVFSAVDVWSQLIPFNQSTVSALRITLSSSMTERNKGDIEALLRFLDQYIKVSHREPALFALTSSQRFLDSWCNHTVRQSWIKWT